jgi:hypothetical protein
MSPRIDLLTAMRIDEALILLPLVGRREAARMLMLVEVPSAVILRVLMRPPGRRPILEPTFKNGNI